MTAGPPRRGDRRVSALDTQSLRAATTLGILHAGLATAGVFGFLVILRHGRGPVGGGYNLVHASGIVALIWSYAGLVLGLVIGVRPGGFAAIVGRTSTGPPRNRPTLLALHRQINLVVIALTVLHLLSYALDPGGSLLVALVPFTATTQNWGYAPGVLALYLAVLLGPSYYLRDLLGRRTWLVIHQFAAISYAFGLWHTLILGSDFRIEGTARVWLWAAQIPMLALLFLRLFRPLRQSDQVNPLARAPRFDARRHTRLRVAVVVGLISTIVVVLLVTLIALGPAFNGPAG